MTSTQFPPTLSQEKKEFIKAFYSVSDTPGATDKYVDFLTEDVDFIMGLKAIQGVPAVRKMRETMWSDVTTRRHTPTQVYTFNQESNDLMIHGKASSIIWDQFWVLRHVLTRIYFVLTCQVSYGLKNGTSVEDVGWAARMVFAQGGELKMKSYQAALLSTLAIFQVWLDAAPLADAVKEMHKH
ncbi:BZ3500_MvSof-1268-A1-R1_Chr7-2g09509 [Microbotryum saponariae]|uniref:BZ3500_MvSof-1268-A1-R1_Chr7-2g09509 protein n=1 Tax=Microbotryum saponariae TaxID=289078 RepID=A0A2X0LSU5_9BASI|nr:BZ3501_MvSof-1269-A2-R1_Chr7-1g09209 [Microbotryum saponariae]SDA02593.1 BZ3500_MvSof-1268-A1-R1_Chr7-2g09509 [Microbotryum saponariae]